MALREQQIDLSVTESRMRSIVETISSAVYTCDDEGLITYYNRRAADLWGQSPKLGESDQRFCGSWKLSQPDGTPLPHDKTPMATVLRTGVPIHGEQVVIRRPDGSTVHVVVHIDPLFDHAGHLCGAINIFEDVTARKQAEEALHESQERWHTLLEVMPAAIFTCDAEGLITYYNRRAVELWGRAPKLRDPEDRYCGSYRIYRTNGSLLSHAECPMAVAVRTGRGTRNEEIHFLRPDGTTIIASVNVDPLFDQQGRRVGAINVFEDVTRRKQAEERLLLIQELSEAVNRAQAVEQIYDIVLDGLQRVLHVDRASILLLDQEGKMRFAAWRALSNPYRARMDGNSPWTADDPHPAPVLIPDVEQLESLSPYLQSIRDEGIGSMALFPLVDQGQMLGRLSLYYNRPHVFTDAEVQWAETIARHVAHALQRKQAEERLQNYAKTLADLNATLEQRVEERTEELQRSNRDLEQFAYVASHDLKAPLRAIGNLASWIAQDAADSLPAASQDHLDKLLARVHRMEVLLNDLLTYSRVGRLRHVPEEVSTVALVQGVVEMLAPPPGFTVIISPTLPVLATERTPLESVFRNLIGNAIKHHHNPSKGQVEITSVDQGAFVEFSVRDNGPGIAPMFHERIFEMFQTLESRDRIEGSGIGLTMIQKYVESRGGTVKLESDTGRGATFRFTWPKITP